MGSASEASRPDKGFRGFGECFGWRMVDTWVSGGEQRDVLVRRAFEMGSAEETLPPEEFENAVRSFCDSRSSVGADDRGGLKESKTKRSGMDWV
jgi:hypothetical protein